MDTPRFWNQRGQNIVCRMRKGGFPRDLFRGDSAGCWDQSGQIFSRSNLDKTGLPGGICPVRTLLDAWINGGRIFVCPTEKGGSPRDLSSADSARN
jgi:hypothetical protein